MSRRLLFAVQEALFFTTHRLPIAQAMRARGWEIHVAAPNDPAIAAKLQQQGFVFHPIPLARGARDIVAELRLIAAMVGLFRRVKPDLLHLVSIKPVIWGGLVARLLRVPAVVHAITGLGFLFIRDGEDGGLLRRVIQCLYRFALHHRNCVAIFQNGDDLALFEARGMVPSDRWVMIRGCGVDINVFAARPEPPIDEGHPPVVMFPARLLGDKGVREFVAAARLLQGEGVTARFVLVGRRAPDNPTDIGETALQEWIARGIEYWGYAEDMPGMLARAHIIVLPSYREGLPRGLIEAAAVGRAIVTTNVPGCREVVRHGENGLLVPVRDGAATAEAIRRLLNDGELRQRLARRGRAIAEAEFSVEHFVAASLAAYDRVLATADAAKGAG